MYCEILIFYVLFPLAILWGVKIKGRSETKEFLLSVKESDIFKGIAAWMVIFTHYTTYLSREGISLGILSPFMRLGSLGVGIFFFLSGYGLAVSSRKKEKLGFSFLKKRFINVYVPYVVMQAVAYILLGKSYTGVEFVLYILGIIEPKWFIIIILLMYLCFWMIDYIGLNKYREVISFIFSISLSVTLYMLGFEEYWYATNILFVVGLVSGKYEKKLINFIDLHYGICVLISIIGFGTSIVLYSLGTTDLAVLGKTAASVFLVFICMEIVMKFKLNSVVMQWFGKMSLYLYLVHSTIYVFLFKYWDLFLPLKTIVFFGVVILCSYVFYKCMTRTKK